MAEQKTTVTLSKLAKNFSEKADALKNKQERHDYIGILELRVTQLTTLLDEAKLLTSCSTLLKSKAILHSIPKRKLSGRINKLKNLIDKYTNSIEYIIKPQLIDTEIYKDTYNEIEEKLKADWKNFASYDKRADSYVKVTHEDNSCAQLANKLSNLIAEIKQKNNELPLNKEIIDHVISIKKEIIAKCNKLETEGFDEEISAFLNDTRDNGFSLTKLLGNKKVLNWLGSKNRTNAFIVIRKK